MKCWLALDCKEKDYMHYKIWKPFFDEHFKNVLTSYILKLNESFIGTCIGYGLSKAYQYNTKNEKVCIIKYFIDNIGCLKFHSLHLWNLIQLIHLQVFILIYITYNSFENLFIYSTWLNMFLISLNRFWIDYKLWILELLKALVNLALHGQRSWARERECRWKHVIWHNCWLEPLIGLLKARKHAIHCIQDQ